VNTLPDYLAPGLDIVFVGINPGAYSVEVGRYFATPANRFWPAVNRSGLLAAPLSAGSDYMGLEQGIGFTDVVKRPSNSASKLRAADYRRWAPVLKEKLERCAPLIVCFHGVTAFRGYMKYAEGHESPIELGRQRHTIGRSRVFVVPNPSAANASYSADDLAEWYRRLKEFRDEMRPA
jgi:TDG/mug DNA glycosylase family protein